ncbi:MAG: DUF423 domain-containing protein [Chitinophagaceae bacterium]|nr:DUF423 domain-containing protein [Chitinophagaceae bacterium]
MHKPFLITAAAFGALAVMLGAFGAHSLKEVLSPVSLNIFETGVRYHFYHSFALLATGILSDRFRNKWIKYSGYSFIAGIILFSGSLYALAFLQASGNVGMKNIGVITPFGGLFFIAGWVFLIVAFSVKGNSLKSV